MDQQTCETEISSLPPEMILKIFGFLTFRDRLGASRTCKEWQKLAINPRKMRIRINEHNCLAISRNIQAYEKYRNASVLLPRRSQKKKTNLCLCQLVRMGGSCRNPEFHSNYSSDEIRSSMAYVVKTAPIEMLVIFGDRYSIKTFLNDNLLSMNQLTSLAIADSSGTDYCVITISHPTLKSISIRDQTKRGLSFEINCPSLIDLTIGRNIENTDHVVSQLQHQLQSLEHSCDGNRSNKIVAKLSNLKKFCVKLEMAKAMLPFSKMRSLEELELCNKHLQYMLVGKHFDFLTNLSKLKLSRIAIDAEAFTTAVTMMPGLRDLQLIQCKFIPSPASSDQITLENVINLYMDCKSENFSAVLPHFTKLKRLTLTNLFAAEIDDTVMRISDLYPELEKLRFESKNPAKRKFYSSTSFSHIRKLKHLKDLQLVGLDLDGIDWTVCNGISGLKLELDRCRFRGSTALQLGESIGRGLLQLSMNNCYLSPPQMDIFEIGKNCVTGLRRHLPWCRVTYKDCCLMYDDQEDDYGFSPSFQNSGEFRRRLQTTQDLETLEVVL